MKCELCQRETTAEETLCQYHRLARDNLVSNFKRWQEAYDALSWKEYCERLLTLQETGVWVKEVAAHMLKQESGAERKWS